MKHLVPSTIARHCFLVSIFVLFVVGVMFASPAFAKDDQTPVGQWHATVTFLTGSMTGQTQNVDYTFNADKTMTTVVTSGSSAGLQGKGTWQETNNHQLCFDFDERVVQNNQFVGIVHVAVQAHFTRGGDEFKGDAQGTFTDANGKVLSQNTATATAERAH